MNDNDALPAARTLQVRAAANKWISDNFPTRRRFLGHTAPTVDDDGWRVGLLARRGKDSAMLAELVISGSDVMLVGATPESVTERLDAYIEREPERDRATAPRKGQFHDFRFGDGIAGSAALDDRSVDLLLTDPPYGISAAYTCENQVSRRLRRNGTDFIMPRGHFGPWDDAFPKPREWLDVVLPKVRGWAVVFCAQAQIGEYDAILREHKFVAVGTLVWRKTNPVPFNHTFKPINAWEAVAVGKRPGTKFNGSTVHNVFVCKSPSPQERIHPTQKPVALISEFIDLFSDEGDTVLDPFTGGATTVVSGVAKRRRVLAFENDAAIFEAAAARVAAMGELL